MKAKDLIELNNKKRKLLTKENEATYGDMLVYIRLANIPEQQVEELLLEILDHLLDAQEEKKNAYDIFGNDLQAYCDEIITALPKQNIWQKIATPAFMSSYLLAIFFATNSLAAFISPFFSDNKRFQFVQINFIYVFVIIIAIHLAILFVFDFIKGDLFNNHMDSWKRITRFIFQQSLWFMLIVISLFFIDRPFIKYQLSPWIGSLLAITFYFFYKIFYRRVNF
ncbi:DUF1129 family protein [Bacillus pseudomycoides]|uniref:DUF1129 domain-containing protein n=1 Tax=Bacillus pseudomycoides TaxID=64104 RepID=A0A2B5RNI9_9BACI|nr:DUF1129 family protein [Bacillus pseudomycoides]PDY49066.1 DUF1129 domain-containing protein [Bacillus pseudomycoides]PEA85223.1 DUF1129 domain-containing protein [Bacillus pseudomycoides]PED72962.1 DUF1129 domain-containing protein [Bacillus pseudomycoides]PEI45089.1 DUF1129 domain-containing protein [Bacillus pseudomycoides]PEJ79481.1 DUF1129 domain-containing protein [Bacillus pseudomycoides]